MYGEPARAKRAVCTNTCRAACTNSDGPPRRFILRVLYNQTAVSIMTSLLDLPWEDVTVTGRFAERLPSAKDKKTLKLFGIPEPKPTNEISELNRHFGQKATGGRTKKKRGVSKSRSPRGGPKRSLKRSARRSTPRSTVDHDRLEFTCVRQTTKKYLTRDSPPYPANHCEGSVKAGNKRGPYWRSVPDKNDMYHWKHLQI
jgi:hypothetical protein